MKNERRRESRVPMFTFADIHDVDGNAIIEATIRQISENGATLRLKSPETIPEKLVIRSKIGQKSYPARFRWMSGAIIGVEFDNCL